MLFKQLVFVVSVAVWVMLATYLFLLFCRDVLGVKMVCEHPTAHKCDLEFTRTDCSHRLVG